MMFPSNCGFRSLVLWSAQYSLSMSSLSRAPKESLISEKYVHTTQLATWESGMTSVKTIRFKLSAFRKLRVNNYVKIWCEKESQIKYTWRKALVVWCAILFNFFGGQMYWSLQIGFILKNESSRPHTVILFLLELWRIYLCYTTAMFSPRRITDFGLRRLASNWLYSCTGIFCN